MVFASLTFLTVFLPLSVLMYFAVGKNMRNATLLGLSLVFYTWGSGKYVLALLFTSAVTYLAGRLLVRAAHRRRLIVLLAAALALAPLLYFKYAAFISEAIADVGGWVGLDLPTFDRQTLPIGISFFTFQALSYVIDVARRDAQTARSFTDYLLYISMFPPLIAGPIVRYSAIADQIRCRSSSLERTAAGLHRFVYGLAKKVLIADAVASIANAAFADADVSSTAAWIGAIAYTVQIYFDFSGYSDMAIGLGMIFGFKIPENFDRPYSALSITDFWRRWHITLSTWFRDYVFIPLGGSRGGSARTYRNLCIVFLLTALWHGAAWTFLLWGGLHAATLLVERITGRNWIRDAPRPWFARSRTLLLVCVFWVPFRAASLTDAADVWGAMFSPSGLAPGEQMIAALTLPNAAALLVGVASFAAPRTWSGFATLQSDRGAVVPVRRVVVMAFALTACLGSLSSGSLSPFLYFQF